MTERKNYLHQSDEVLRKKTEEVDENGKHNKVLTMDRTLNAACAGEDYEVLTPERIEELGKHMDAHLKDVNELFPDIVRKTPEIVRLAVACQVMKAIFDNGKEGGSFRHLIYNRLGFSEACYTPLHLSGGTVISNHLDLSRYDERAEVMEMLRKLGVGLTEEDITTLADKHQAEKEQQ